jgi:hypothetical protein
MRYYKPSEITTKNHFLVGTVWPIEGSKNNTYSIEMHEKGFTCDCQGFMYRGKCKHTSQVTSLLINENFPRYNTR